MANINTFVCFTRQRYCFTSLRLIVQITARFSVDTRSLCLMENLFMQVCACVSVRVIQICAPTAHSALIDLLNGRGCLRTVAGRPFQ